MTVFVSMPLILNLTVDAIEALKWELLLLYQPTCNDNLSVTASIAGREVTFYPFHFPPLSYAYQNVLPSSKIVSFLDDNKIYLRKWSIKAAVLINESYLLCGKSTNDMITRGYFSFCQLVGVSNASDKNFILLSILTTFNLTL